MEPTTEEPVSGPTHVASVDTGVAATTPPANVSVETGLVALTPTIATLPPETATDTSSVASNPSRDSG